MQTLNKRRQAEQAESAANRLGPKGNGVGTRAIDFLVMGKRKRKMKPTFPAKRADLTCRVPQEERGKPDTPPRRGRRPVTLLTYSYSGKYIAVRRVTENRGNSQSLSVVNPRSEEDVFERLEPDEVKISRPVLRGGGGDVASLPDP